MKKVSFVAAAGMTMWALMQVPSAQQIDQAVAAQAAMQKAITLAGSKPNTTPAPAAHDKIDAAMSGATNPLPTDADRKAAAAMAK
jgi:hypothetical protein